MSAPIVLVVVLPILCAIFGFAFGIAAAKWRSYLGTHETYSQPSVTNKSNEVSCLEEIAIHASSPCETTQRTAIPASSTIELASSRELTTTPIEQFNVGLPPPGLAQIRTPIRQSSGDDILTQLLDSQQATTPLNNNNNNSRAATGNQQLYTMNMTTPVNNGIGAAALGPTPYTRPRSPTAHLMGHLVRCASQAIDQIESQSVLQRLLSADAASSQFFAPSPMPSGFLLSPAVGPALAGGDQNQHTMSSTAFSAGAGADEIHIDEVDLISKLGGGSFGSVYRGNWRGAPVAVKYIRTRTDEADSLGSAIREVVLSKKLTHPNIVQTFSWTVLVQPQLDGDKEESKNTDSTDYGGVLDINRNESDVSEIASLSSSLLHRTESLGEEGRGAAAAVSAVTGEREEEQFERYSIPAVWNNNNTNRSTSFNSNPLLQQQKQHLKTPVLTSAASPLPSSSSTSSLSRGVKRRRTGLDSATPSPTTLGLDPRMDSFNSEEGFGSPVKKKHGGVQSIFKLESLQLTESEALLVVVMEHCDLGSLQRALDRRAFLPSAKWPQHATFRALLRTAAEVAKGMEYIHGQHGVVHGDLKPANVLLKTHRADRRGYVAKVADFGLSWHVESEEENFDNFESSKKTETTTSTPDEGTNNINNANNHTTSMNTATVGGTIAYLPPEAFEGKNGSRGRPGDVYAFGVMLWSMYYCKQPYKGMMEAQVCAGVLGGWLRPEFTEDCPAAFRYLAERCWSQDPGDRPTFAQVWRELVNIEVNFRSQRLRSKSGSGGGNVVFGAAGDLKRPASAPIRGETAMADN